jgi:hypothetical protein
MARGLISSETAGLINIVDGRHFTITRKIRLPAGSKPMGLAMNASRSKLYISTGWGGTVCVLDTTTEKIANTINVGKGKAQLGARLNDRLRRGEMAMLSLSTPRPLPDHTCSSDFRRDKHRDPGSPWVFYLSFCLGFLQYWTLFLL